MYRIFRTKTFERSFRKLKQSGRLSDSLTSDLEKTIDILAAGKSLPPSARDHQLRGELAAYRECHIRGDVLLVYQKNKKDFVLVLVDIGSHSYLFE